MFKWVILLFFWFNFAFAAISSTAIWDIRSTATAANANGCFFNSAGSSPGTDFSTQNSAQYNLTGLTSAGAGDTILTSSAVADMNRNGINITSGTNFTVGRYEIIAVSVGVSIQVDRAVTTGVGATGVGNIGGACVNFLDADLEAATPSNLVYIKGGVTYTPTGAIAITTGLGGASTPIKYIGFTTTHGDGANGTARPTIAMGANAYSVGANIELYNIIFTTTAANGVNMGANDKMVNCKSTNSSTTASRNAINLSSDNFIFNSEFVSYRGNAINAGNNPTNIIGNYIHDSNVGAAIATTSTGATIIGNVFEGNVTTGLDLNASGVVATVVSGNTFYGAENNLGVGVNIATGSTDLRFFNNIFYGFVTGITHADAAGANITYEDYNVFNTNTTARTNITAGTNDVTTAPSFANLTQVTATNATISGSVITSSGATFPTFVPGVDFLYLKSGTAGPTFGIYGIVSNTATTITVDIAPGNSATADHVLQVTQGHDFRIGSGIRAIGFPSLFPGGLMTGYVDPGAIQRREFITTGH